MVVPNDLATSTPAAESAVNRLVQESNPDPGAGAKAPRNAAIRSGWIGAFWYSFSTISCWPWAPGMSNDQSPKEAALDPGGRVAFVRRRRR